MTTANPQCAIGGATLTPGSLVTVDINVTNAPAFRGYEFSLFFDQKLLTLHSVNFASGTMFNNPFVATNDNSTWGTIRETVVNLASGTDNGTRFGSGILIEFVFNVKGLGASPFVLAAGTSQPAEGGGAAEGDWTRLVFVNNQFIDVSTSDGYFQNNPPKLGPVAKFTFVPAQPVLGQAISFNATASFDPDNSTSRITRYFWDFGNGVSKQSASPVQSYSLTQPSGTPLIGNFSVLLITLDSDNNFTGMVTHLVDVKPAAVHDVSVGIILDHSQVQPGGNITVMVTITNLGNFAETYSLSITYGPPTVALQNYVNQVISSASGQNMHIFTNMLDTKGLSLGTYEVDAVVTDPADTNLSNNIAKTAFTIALPAADFSLQVSPSFLSIPASTSAPAFSTITVTGLNGFAGTISLTVSTFGFVSNPPMINPSQVTLGAYSSANATLAVFAGNSAPGTSYSANVMATSGSLHHSFSVFVQIVAPPPDFQLDLLASSNGNVVFAGTSTFVGVELLGTGFAFYNGNVTLTGQISPSLSHGPTLSFNPVRLSFIPPGFPFSTLTISTTSSTPPGNYTITIIGNDGIRSHSVTFQLTVLPPPVLTLSPNGGSLGTLVTVHGSGFFLPSQAQFFSPVELQMTFDDQLMGLVFLQGSSFNFSFDVPHAQVGTHQVHAKELFPSNLDVQASFLVTPEPASLGLTVTVGSIYFPGDTATVFVMTTLNGQPTTVTSLQIVVVRPNGSSIMLNAALVTAGVYKASYAVPSNGPLGTYAVIAKAQQASSGSASAIGSFEVKPTWLQANGRNLLTGTTVVGAVGMLGLLAVAWRRGYFGRGKEEFEAP
jgi:hypothetical protein